MLEDAIHSLSGVLEEGLTLKYQNLVWVKMPIQASDLICILATGHIAVMAVGKIPFGLVHLTKSSRFCLHCLSERQLLEATGNLVSIVRPCSDRRLAEQEDQASTGHQPGDASGRLGMEAVIRTRLAVDGPYARMPLDSVDLRGGYEGPVEPRGPPVVIDVEESRALFDQSPEDIWVVDYVFV
jgi:hypothetical protein